MILITGSMGFIGSHLKKKVRAAGIDLKKGLNLLTCPLPKADFVYHFAAQSSVEASWKDPLHDLDSIRLTARLVHNYPDARIIFANSSASKQRSSPYGFSKWASAEYIKKFHTNYVICTLPNVYGPGGRSVIDVFKGKERVDIYGDGLQTRSYVHVDDIVEAFIKAQNWPVGEYELGNGRATSVLEIAGNKTKIFHPARKEDKHIILNNTTPDWVPTL